MPYLFVIMPVLNPRVVQGLSEFTSVLGRRALEQHTIVEAVLVSKYPIYTLISMA